MIILYMSRSLLFLTMSNPYSIAFRAVPINPASRLPAESIGPDAQLAQARFDFGSVRPARILKSTPGQRELIDKEATMRANLHTVGADDGYDLRDFTSSWSRSQSRD